MGASESSLSSSQSAPADVISTVSERSEAVDLILERLKSLKITTPVLKSPPTEGILTDILVRKPSSSSNAVTVNPQVLLELFSMYRNWQDEKVQKINKNQEDIENKIEVTDALAIKLLQCLNFSVSVVKTASQHLSEVHALEVEIGELKGRLTEVISNCNALCRRIASEGPEALQPSIKPLVATADSGSSCNSASRYEYKTKSPRTQIRLIHYWKYFWIRNNFIGNHFAIQENKGFHSKRWPICKFLKHWISIPSCVLYIDFIFQHSSNVENIEFKHKHLIQRCKFAVYSQTKLLKKCPIGLQQGSKI